MSGNFSPLNFRPPQASEILLTGTVVSLLLLTVYFQLRPSRNKAPIVNPKTWLELTWDRAGKEFAYGSKDILTKATRAMKGKPFQVYSTQGFMTVLPSKHIQETRNDARFDFAAHTHRAFNGSTPGFEAFDQRNDMSWWLVQIAQKHLTAYLNQMSLPLSKECSKDLKQYLGNAPTWHAIDPSEEIGRIVSKMSTRIFLGQEFCEDERWIEASSSYSTKVFSAQDRLSLWPAYLRPVVHWFLPYCQQLRKDVAVCRSVIEGKLKEREKVKALREKQGEAPDEIQDTLEWMKKVAKGRTFDPTKVQLTLSMAAIHTTTDLITWLLLCLAQNPEAIEPLRNEMISVLKADGWKKTSLYNLKLLDSSMKESQRLKPNVLATMRRLTTADITLSDGTFIPRNTMTLTMSDQFRDPTVYPDPDKFQFDRFYNMRQIPGKENHAQFVTTSPQHMGFSHGQHSCPGRFFAANETKILMCHLLLKYEFKLTHGAPSDSVAFGFALIPNPGARLDIRRRKEEIDLSALTA